MPNVRDLSSDELSVMRDLTSAAGQAGMNTTHLMRGDRSVEEVGARIGQFAKDPKGLPVERYRLTDEQHAHLKKVQKFQSIRRALEEMTLKEQARFKSIQQMWMAMNKGLQLLANEAPKEMTREVPGMDFAQEMEQRTPAGPQELEQAQQEMQASPEGGKIAY